MTTPPINLDVIAPVTLDGSGNGTARLTPDGPNEHWHPTIVSVKVSTNTLEAQCRIYSGPAPTDSWIVEGTLSGSTGDSTDHITGHEISRTRGDPAIWAVWTGGDPGGTATVRVIGTKEFQR